MLVVSILLTLKSIFKVVTTTTIAFNSTTTTCHKTHMDGGSVWLLLLLLEGIKQHQPLPSKLCYWTTNKRQVKILKFTGKVSLCASVLCKSEKNKATK